MLLLIVRIVVIAGGLSGGGGLDPLQEGCGLAALPEHLSGLVRHCSHSRPLQRCCHGPVRLWHTALRLRCRWVREVLGM